MFLGRNKSILMISCGFYCQSIYLLMHKLVRGVTCCWPYRDRSECSRKCDCFWVPLKVSTNLRTNFPFSLLSGHHVCVKLLGNIHYTCLHTNKTDFSIMLPAPTFHWCMIFFFCLFLMELGEGVFIIYFLKNLLLLWEDFI